jgi:hypothetical protein
LVFFIKTLTTKKLNNKNIYKKDSGQYSLNNTGQAASPLTGEGSAFQLLKCVREVIVLY